MERQKTTIPIIIKKRKMRAYVAMSILVLILTEMRLIFAVVQLVIEA